MVGNFPGLPWEDSLGTQVTDCMCISVLGGEPLIRLDFSKKLEVAALDFAPFPQSPSFCSGISPTQVLQRTASGAPTNFLKNSQNYQSSSPEPSRGFIDSPMVSGKYSSNSAERATVFSVEDIFSPLLFMHSSAWRICALITRSSFSSFSPPFFFFFYPPPLLSPHTPVSPF